MVKHKTEDYKLSAVNYYIKNKVSMDTLHYKIKTL